MWGGGVIQQSLRRGFRDAQLSHFYVNHLIKSRLTEVDLDPQDAVWEGEGPRGREPPGPAPPFTGGCSREPSRPPHAVRRWALQQSGVTRPPSTEGRLRLRGCLAPVCGPAVRAAVRRPGRNRNARNVPESPRHPGSRGQPRGAHGQSRARCPERPRTQPRWTAQALADAVRVPLTTRTSSPVDACGAVSVAAPLHPPRALWGPGASRPEAKGLGAQPPSLGPESRPREKEEPGVSRCAFSEPLSL